MTPSSAETGNDVLYGGAGNDYIDGGAPYSGLAGDDVFYGGDGNDTLVTHAAGRSRRADVRRPRQ